MAKGVERRHSVRITIPSELRSPGLGQHQVWLLDLSPEGVRVEHVHPFSDGHLCLLDLPPALGGAGLQGTVIWSREAGRKEVGEGDWVFSFQSGIHFSGLTPGQQEQLATALEILKTTQEG